MICDVDKPPVVNVEHAQGDDDEAVEDDVKLPDVGQVIIYNVQQSSTVFLYAVLMKISRVKLFFHFILENIKNVYISKYFHLEYACNSILNN